MFSPAFQRVISGKRAWITRVCLVSGLLAAVLGAAVGAGYRSSHAVLGDAGNYVQKGHTVVHVNAESGETDAKAARELANRRQRLEVVQVGPDRVYVVNNDTGETWRLPTDTMRPDRVQDTPGAPPTPAGGAQGGGPQDSDPQAGGAQGGPAPGGPDSAGGSRRLLAGGGKAYLLHAADGTLALLDGRQARPVALPSRVDEAVVDSHGTAWALSRPAGKLYQIVGTALRAERTVSVPKGSARLTLAGDHPIVYLPTHGNTGMAKVIGDGVAHPQVELTPAADGAVRVALPGADAPVLVSVVQTEDTVVVVDFRTGEETRLTLAGREGIRDYGQPVVTGGRIYLPDYRARQVVVLQLRPLRQLRSVQIPGTGRFTLSRREGRVWVNDPYARRMIVLAGDQLSEIDKGPGDGVDGDESPVVAPSRTPTTRPAPPRRRPGRVTTSGPPDRPGPTPSRGTPSRPAPPRLVEVPVVAGQDQDAACAGITAAQLNCETTTQQAPGCRTGQAVRTVPDAGARVAPRTRVTVFICGPTTVPALAGTLVDQACQTVEAAELVCVPVEGGVAQSAADLGRVIGQDPAATTQVPNGTRVTVTFLSKDRVTVPSVVNMAPDQACATLQSAGFGCARNSEEVTWEPNVVHAQDPAAGTALASGSPVQVTYQDTAAGNLYRYKVNGLEARLLSLDPNTPGGFNPQGPIGGAYLAAGGVPGLVTVYQFHCSDNCGGSQRDVSYYYNQVSSPPNSNYTPEGPAFSCFGSQVPGTVRLLAMYSSQKRAWAFAPEGSQEHAIHAANTYVDQYNICYIWFGVPAFRPNG